MSQIHEYKLRCATNTIVKHEYNCKQNLILAIRGGIKKKNWFFSEKLRKGGGGLAESEISLSEKNEIFLDFFSKRGGVSPIPKGCYHKNWGFLDIFTKREGFTTQSMGIL